jgi:phosphoribosylformylglycinamidine cyclo-ligase
MAASGLHSNGYSLARHVAFNLAGLDVHDHIAEFGRTLGEELLEPTKIYSLDVLSLIKNVEVHSVSHITGGGLSANIARVMPTHLALDVQRATWRPHEIFHFIMARGNVAQAEAERTFNMGMGMLAFVKAEDADQAIAHLASRGVTAWSCGVVRERAAGEFGDSSAKGGNGGAVTLVGNYAN